MPDGAALPPLVFAKSCLSETVASETVPVVTIGFGDVEIPVPGAIEVTVPVPGEAGAQLSTPVADVITPEVQLVSAFIRIAPVEVFHPNR